jgi:hypothetical protein
MRIIFPLFIFKQTVHRAGGPLKRLIVKGRGIQCINISELLLMIIILFCLWHCLNEIETFKSEFLIENEPISELLELESLFFADF